MLHPAAKPLVFMLCLLPFAWLFYAACTDQLGANPAEALIRATGDWTLRFVCIVLAVTPLRVITGTPALARFRRMLGLFVYFYVVLHLLSYSWFDMGFDVAGDRQGHHQAAVHPGGVFGLRAADAAGGHLVQRAPSRPWARSAGSCCTSWCI